MESPIDLPPPDERTIDVAILDMNHGWPNLGHDSIVHAVQDAACDLAPVLEPAGLRIRALSFEVRQRHMIPEPPGGRFAIYVGTGGPGDIDPYRNDGTGAGTQGIREDPAWERRLFALFDRIRDSPDAALLAVCHSFGVMCRWSAIAQPVLRPAEKGGKSAGILENVLTEEGARHPWFRQLAEELPDHRRLTSSRPRDPCRTAWSRSATRRRASAVRRARRSPWSNGRATPRESCRASSR